MTDATAAELDEVFDGPLDRDVWFPYYLPHWSSRAEAAATYEVGADGLHLWIPEDQPRWCAGLHDDPPLRVSCIQTGSFCGPVGSTVGQQPFGSGLEVREEQPTFWGCTPRYGHVEIRMRGEVSPRSMFAFWLSGIEDRPERSGEICIAEVFGRDLRPGGADVGIGLHRFRDPGLQEEFSTVPLDLDVTEDHRYAVDWRPGSLAFTVDGAEVRRVDQAPDYPVQLMLGVFDFPSWAGREHHVPRMVVSEVRVHPLG